MVYNTMRNKTPDNDTERIGVTWARRDCASAASFVGFESVSSLGRISSLMVLERMRRQSDSLRLDVRTGIERR